ncbi:hypothetical protein GQ53DRAFT_835137 [Thozetella sp. PMI_491]|nr:hypothetical protein GQ53DRAFT_835137 [Thozetella sp. PMI_491]
MTTGNTALREMDGIRETVESTDVRGKFSIRDLPLDILREIFDFLPLRSNRIRHWGRSHDIVTICNARLSCRLFYEIASPHLIPLLEVQLDQQSLDTAVGLLNNPFIAAGIYEIRLMLQYRPREVADSLEYFAAIRKLDLHVAIADGDYHNGPVAADFQMGSEMELPRSFWSYETTYQCIQDAWDAYVKPKDDDSTGGAEGVNRADPTEESGPMHGAEYKERRLKYQKILVEGYDEFRRKQLEQDRLLQGQFFVNSLASAMSSMKHPVSLTFTDEVNSWCIRSREGPVAMLHDPNELSRIIAYPLSWRTIEGLRSGGSTSLLPARILSELPIAIHKTGVAIASIHIQCFPRRGGYLHLRPLRQGQVEPRWDELRAVCRQLKLVHFAEKGDLYDRLSRESHLPDHEKASIDEYLGAMLSGGHLEDILLNMYCMGTSGDQWTWGPEPESYDLNPVLRAIDSSCLKRIDISTITIDQDDLESFSKQLGDRMESLRLHCIELQNGSWAGTLDILRERVAARCREGRCTVDFSVLLGGGFGGRKEFLDNRPYTDGVEWDDGSMHGGWGDYGTAFGKDGPGVEMAQAYVSGVAGAINPLACRE